LKRLFGGAQHDQAVTTHRERGCSTWAQPQLGAGGQAPAPLPGGTQPFCTVSSDHA